MTRREILEKNWKNFRVSTGLEYEPMSDKAYDFMEKAMEQYAELRLADDISRFTKFKNYGTATDGSIFYIDEEKLNLDHINEIRNYLNSREKLLVARK